jgi:hypothetical protein
VMVVYGGRFQACELCLEQVETVPIREALWGMPEMRHWILVVTVTVTVTGDKNEHNGGRMICTKKCRSATTRERDK